MMPHPQEQILPDSLHEAKTTFKTLLTKVAKTNNNSLKHDIYNKSVALSSLIKQTTRTKIR